MIRLRNRGAWVPFTTQESSCSSALCGPRGDSYFSRDLVRHVISGWCRHE